MPQYDCSGTTLATGPVYLPAMQWNGNELLKIPDGSVPYNNDPYSWFVHQGQPANVNTDGLVFACGTRAALKYNALFINPAKRVLLSGARCMSAAKRENPWFGGTGSSLLPFHVTPTTNDWLSIVAYTYSGFAFWLHENSWYNYNELYWGTPTISAAGKGFVTMTSGGSTGRSITVNGVRKAVIPTATTRSQSVGPNYIGGYQDTYSGFSGAMYALGCYTADITNAAASALLADLGTTMI